jgi:hypothetical protein
MKPYSKLLSALLLALFAFTTACEESDDQIIIQPQNQLVAVAGADKTIFVNEELTLDGSASFDRNNKAFTYSWSIKLKPAGSAVALSQVNNVSTIIKPDVSGLYVIELQIIQGQWTAKDEVNIQVNNVVPNGPTTVILDGNINSNTTFPNIFEDPERIDYIVTQNIEVWADLTIMPGVTMAFQEDKGLQIMSGYIKAIGSNISPIIFTSLEEESAYWKGIAIYSNNELNEFNFVTIKNGGSVAFNETGIRANVFLSGNDFSAAALKINNSTFSNSGGYGLYVQGGSSLSGQQQITFSNNQQAAAFIPARLLNSIDPVSYNAGNVLETGGLVSQETELVWKKLSGGSYLVTKDIQLKAGITIEAGATFAMKSGISISVSDNGYLNASGTQAAPVKFTSTGNQVYWNGLYFNSYNFNNSLNYTEVSNAGLYKIGDGIYPANITVSAQGLVKVENSTLLNGLGYGLVAQNQNAYNENFTSSNTFSNLQSGIVFPEIIENPLSMLTGEWVDYWSFTNGLSSIAPNFYNKESGVWFNGAANPWAMNPRGFGLRFTDHGNFVWTIAERSPMTGCESYSAEYITGSFEILAGSISFNQNYWRSKFTNSCDESQEVDIEVTPSVIPIQYQISKVNNPFTNTEVWKLTFTNPGGSSFFFYKKID